MVDETNECDHKWVMEKQRITPHGLDSQRWKCKRCGERAVPAWQIGGHG